MFFTESDVGWLLGEWLRWESSRAPLASLTTCLRLAHGFVGCNLIIDLLAQQRYLYLNTGFSGVEFAPGLSCDLVYDWLVNPRAVPATADPFLLVTGAASMAETVADHDPWREIVGWAFRESVVRHLRPVVNGARTGRTQAYVEANAVFNSSRTIPAPPTNHAGCSSRSRVAGGPPVNPTIGVDCQVAFERWWDHLTAKLTDHLDHGGWTTGWSGPGLNLFCLSNNWASCNCPLTVLLRAKNHQWDHCLSIQRAQSRWAPTALNYVLGAPCHVEDLFSKAGPVDMAVWQKIASRESGI